MALRIRTVLPASERALLESLSKLLGVAQVYLTYQMRPRFFCKRCEKEIQSGEFCFKCGRQDALEERIHARYSPMVKTVGGMVKW
jgi:hypothetical protein